jgi:acyl carrier protein
LDKAEIIATLEDLLIDVLDLDEVSITEATTAKDVEGWDSLSHIRLMVAIEQRLRIKFSTGEIERMNNVGDMVKAIELKLQAR